MENDKTSAQLMEYLILHRFNEGEKIPNEYELAKELEVSRRAIRLAVKKLVDQKILEIKRGKGTFLTSHLLFEKNTFGQAFFKSQIDLALETIEFRLLVEPWAAKQAASVSPAQKMKIQNAFEISKQEKQNDSYLFDFYFHQTIVESSNNSPLKTVLPLISDSISRTIEIDDGSLHRSIRNDHDLINEAIQNGDGERAEQRMREHLQHIQAFLLHIKTGK